MANILTQMTYSPATTKKLKNLHVITWGCQMNVYDSARMEDVLRPLGYRPVAQVESADMVILNTCHIRERATEKVFSELGLINKIREERLASGHGRMVIAVAGCVAQAEGAEIIRRAPYVDIVLGPQTYHRLPEMVARAARAGGHVIETDFPVDMKFDHLPVEAAPQTRENLSAFLTIQEGCDKFCSFCVVPYTRGAESSRPVASIVAEAREMARNGVRELTLLGQNVNAYHGLDLRGQVADLPQLVRAISHIKGIVRIRYTTSHPRDITQSLIDAHRDEAVLMPFLHLPVQSGSDQMLKAMNRGHTADEYRDIIARFRKARPDLAISSDFIVGHPGETEADFESTLQLIRDVGFAQAYTFKYSPRPGTPAASHSFQVDEAVKNARLQIVQNLIRTQQDHFNAAMVGQDVAVLLTHKGRKPGQVIGRSPYQQSVVIDAPEHMIGRLVTVRILQALTNSLAGELIRENICA